MKGRQLSDEKFELFYSYLKILGHLYCGWEDSKANKEHTDINGITISKGERYFKRTIKNKYIKMSKNSMDEMLFLMFEDNELLQSLGNNFIEEKKKEYKDALKKVYGRF